MSARCQRRLPWLVRWFGAASIIAVCAGSLALAGSPQLHERIDHHRTRLIHSCAITLSNTGKCLKAIESPRRPLLRRPPAAIVLVPAIILTPVWVPNVFVEACRFEHGPPAFC
jgi:hypothetical protein